MIFALRARCQLERFACAFEERQFNSNAGLKESIVKSSIVRFATVLLLLVLGVQINAMGAERAFKAQVTGTLEPDLYAPMGVGRATHCGHVFLDAQITFEGLKNYVVTGQLYFYAGNFDYVEAQLDRGQIDPETGIAVVTVHFIGGSGRFQGATGSATATFTFTNDDGIVFYDLAVDGLIDY